jgi:iron complex outermembrane receptor protein
MVVLPSGALAQTALPPIVVEGENGNVTGGGGESAGRSEGEGAAGPDKTIVAASTAIGTKTDTALIDIPAGVSVVTELEMETRGVQDLQQAIAYTSSVAVDQYGSDDRYDYYYIRGFYQTSTGTYRDGLTQRIGGWTASRMEPYGLQRLEILKGSTSSLFGLNAPGGIVNGITKRPQDAPQSGEVYTRLGEDHFEFGTDFGGRINDDWSYRITMKRQEAADRGDFSSDDRIYIAPALTWRPTDATTLTILADYNKRDGNLQYGFPLDKSGRVVDIDRDTFLGEPAFNAFDTVEKNIGYLFEHKFANGLTVRQNARYTDLTLDYRQVYGAQPDPSIDRSAFLLDGELQRFAIDTQLQYDAKWDGVESKTLVGVDYTHDKLHENGFFGTADGIDIYNPVYCGLSCIGSFVNFTNSKKDQQAAGYYVQEEITFDKRWIVTLGGRYDDVDTTTEVLLNNGTTQVTTDEAFTKRVGLTYKLRENVSLYANYSESFQPVLQPNFAPQEGTQYEVGAKYRPEGMNALFTLALFDLTQTNVPTPLSPITQRQIGEVNVRGIELEGKAVIYDNLNLTLAYSYWDAEIVEDGASGSVSNNGNRPDQVPEHIASIWVDYTIPGNADFGALTLGAGVRYVGQVFGDPENTVSIDAHAVVDAAIKYQIDDDWSLAVNATNLFDKEYLSTIYFGTAGFGDGRTVTATLKHTW